MKNFEQFMEDSLDLFYKGIGMIIYFTFFVFTLSFYAFMVLALFIFILTIEPLLWLTFWSAVGFVDGWLIAASVFSCLVMTILMVKAALEIFKFLAKGILGVNPWQKREYNMQSVTAPVNFVQDLNIQPAHTNVLVKEQEMVAKAIIKAQDSINLLKGGEYSLC